MCAKTYQNRLRFDKVVRKIICRSVFASRGTYTYTLNHKKRDILFLTITLANLNRFLWFLYHFNHEEILRATIVKFTTLP